jgi:predicted DCC family thiol-disulfide oxidoreductase YuxK
VIYCTTGLAKLHGRDWLNGSALAMTLMNPIFVRFDFSWIQNSSFAASFLRFMTWKTLAWEIFFPVLVFAHRYTRWLALLIGVMVHGGIILLLQIHWFGYLMIGSYICFLPNGLFRAIEVQTRRKLRQSAYFKRRMRVIYDGQCAFCCQAVLLVSLLDFFRRVELIPAKEESKWRKHAPQLQKRELALAMYATTGKDMKPVAGMDAFCEIGKVVPALAPLLWLAAIPGVRPLGRRVYAWVSASRYCLIEN